MAPALVLNRTEGLSNHPTAHEACALPAEGFVSENLNQDKLEPIAVIGFSLRFPQDATSPAALWQMLVEKRSAFTEVPKDRFNFDAFYHQDQNRNDTMNVRGGHFLKEDVGAFDAPFFSITSTEASAMDPQQRILLETAYKAFENAGIPMEQVVGSKTSVYTGCFTRDYGAIAQKDPEILSRFAITSVESSMLANRISWFYDLTGPSANIDTACSSSLMALHLACQSLRSGEASLGLVGGCNTIFNPEAIAAMSNLNFLSPDGKCFSFDHRANGYSRGEGFGLLVIKPLKDALRDGDTVRAVIRATHANQDGRTPGIIQPSSVAQENLIRETYTAGGLEMEPTRFFEAHGTGTPVGDPIEARAIYAAFRDHRNQDDPMYVGAIKSNIGHLEGASGVAGVIKTIMALEKGVIPPNIGFEMTNPKIDADEWHLKFPVESNPWPTDRLRRASVNSFGFGGTNVHAVLDDAYNYLAVRGLTGKHLTAEVPPTFEDLRSQSETKTLQVLTSGLPSPHVDGIELDRTHGQELFVWSASDEPGLKRLTDAYSEHFSRASTSTKDESYFRSLAYTLCVRRSSLPWKSFSIASSISELRQNLQNKLPKPVRSTPQRLKLGFIFTGQGAQWHAMGRELMVYPIFRNSLREAGLYLNRIGCQWSLLDELAKEKKQSHIDIPAFSQPLCTALQIALADLLSTWGIYPSVVIGHSSGEIAAAYCVGGLTRESAWKVAYYRGVLATILTEAKHERGSMMAVGLSAADAQASLDGFAEKHGRHSIVIGCINGPQNVTLSGSETQIASLQVLLDKEKVFTRKLLVSVAYHSPQMDVVSGQYRSLINDLKSGEPLDGSPVMISSITGKMVGRDNLIQGEYWVKNMVSPVRFLDALLGVLSQTPNLSKKLGAHRNATTVHHLLEIGPHSALRGPVKEILTSVKSKEITYNTVLIRHVSALTTSLEMAGHLYCLGYPLNFTGIQLSGGDRQGVQLALTDLPEYPFNHTQKYWHESRLSKNFRFRKHPRHLFLGTTVPDWNPLEARWRNMIKASENPWVLDHKMSGYCLYPGAGMIVMAIEAAKQMAKPGYSIRGYRFRDVTFHTALKTSLDPNGTETQFYLRPLANSEDRGTTWSDFRLYMFENEEWVENCRGNILVEYQEDESVVDRGKESREELICLQKTLQDYIVSCNMTANSAQFYSNLNDWGFGLGKSFQMLQEISYNEEGAAIAQIEPYRDSFEGSSSDDQRCVVHPVTLDGILQLVFPSLTKGGSFEIPTMIPTRVRKLWISNSGLNWREAERVIGYSKSNFTGAREADASIVALDNLSGEIRIKVEGFETTAVVGPSISSSAKISERRLCYGFDWRPDMDLLSNSQVLAYCSAERPFIVQPVEFCQDLEFLCFICMSRIIEEFKQNKFSDLQPHLHKYIMWAEQRIEHFYTVSPQINRPERRELLRDTNYQDDLRDRIRNSNSQGMFYSEIAKNLGAIFRGEIDALDFLFRGDLVKNFYRDAEGPWNCMKLLVRYVDALAHKKPGMNILEVGAGTGGATAPILDILKIRDECGSGVPRYHHYDYTDISPSFFEKAKKLFKDHGDKIGFATLDIEDDPCSQGYNSETYDIVFAANVLHATKDLSLTLQNTRKLLKPGGKLILLEVCNPEILRTGFAFGLLSGWWVSTEEKRAWSPIMFEQDWNEILSRNGFSGTDVIFRDYDDDRCHETSVMISTAVGLPTKNLPIPPTAVVVTENPSVHQASLAQQLCMHLVEKGSLNCETMSIRELASKGSLEQMFCISLLELDSSFLLDMDTKNFNALKRVMKKAKALIWVTHGGGQFPIKPEVDLVTGLSRSSRTENVECKFVQLAIESLLLKPSQEIDLIYRILENTVNSSLDSYEAEYVERDEILYLNRLAESTCLNQDIRSRVLQQQATLQEIGSSPPLVLNIASLGLLDTLGFVGDLDGSRPLAPDEIEVEVRACGVNFRDILIALGRYSDNALGSECAGIVRYAGAEVDLQSGDRVCLCVLGAYRTFLRCKALHAARIPDFLSFAEAAALPTTSITAYYALHEIARLTTGESVLIHSGAGGTGQAAIQVAKLVDAEIYATVGTEEKKKFLIDTYNIQEDHIFYSRDLSFAHGIKRMTRDRGVDVILNSLAGESLIASWECIAPYGRFIELGKKDITSHEKLPMFPFAKNVSFTAVDLADITRNNLKLLHRLQVAVMNLVKSRKLCAAQPLNIYRASQVEEAFRFLQSGKNPGKTIVEFNNEDVVMTVLKTVAAYSFDKNATFVIAGGLGGLGKSIARWMVSRGARNLILLSRSGVQSKTAIAFVRELETRGVCVEAPACDITNVDLLASVMTRYTKTMPPVKGCIQGTMVLKDSTLDKMSVEDFKTALEPKVRGSWNLHSQLPQAMDFFILLSSLTGVIGMGGQANYASGNTYQDALARHRIALGEKAVSIDLGMMLDVGLVAENKSIQNSMNAKGFFMGVSQAELHALLDHFCDPALDLLTPLQSQVVTGIEVPATLRAKRVEEPYWMRRPMFRMLYQLDDKRDTPGSDADGSLDIIPTNFEPLFRAAGSVAEVGNLIRDVIVKKLSRTLGTPLGDIDTNRPMHYYGVDSLVAVEMRNWFVKDMNADVAIFDILGGASIAAVSLVVAGRSGYLNPSSMNQEEEDDFKM